MTTLLASMVRSLNFIRNVAAHHSRLWNINVLELSPLPAGWVDCFEPF
jgi:abortive infection bacteriophage resistance protein